MGEALAAAEALAGSGEGLAAAEKVAVAVGTHTDAPTPVPELHSVAPPAPIVTRLPSFCSLSVTPEPVALARPSAASPCQMTALELSSTATLPLE